MIQAERGRLLRARPGHAVALLMIASLAQHLAAAPGTLTVTQEAKLVPSNPTFPYLFGTSAIDGETAIVGASGWQSAYIFVHAGSTWTQQAELPLPPPGGDEAFGITVAISGDTALVGAPLADHSGIAHAGAAYVFVRIGTSWVEQAKLIAHDASKDSLFGSCVAIADNTALVAAPSDSTASWGQGSAYVFVRSGGTWIEQTKLAASDGTTGGFFGASLALSGETAVIGAGANDHDGLTEAGAAYVFVRSGNTWSQQAKLVAADGSSGDFFGWSVAIAGDSLVASAYTDDEPTLTNAGSAYVFVRTGSSWNEQAKLVAANPSQSALFGYAVAIEGDIVIASAYGKESVYAFQKAGGIWQQQEEWVPSDWNPGDDFGATVSVSDNRLIVGAVRDGAGSAYVYSLYNPWTSVGTGLPGTLGYPVLAGDGDLLGGTIISLDLSAAKPLVLSWLVVGTALLGAPFKGGVMVPSPDLLFALTTDFFGNSSFGGLWPTGVPSGFSTYFQWWILDSAGPKGFAASNAIAGTTP